MKTIAKWTLFILSHVIVVGGLVVLLHGFILHAVLSVEHVSDLPNPPWFVGIILIGLGYVGAYPTTLRTALEFFGEAWREVKGR